MGILPKLIGNKKKNCLSYQYLPQTMKQLTILLSNTYSILYDILTTFSSYVFNTFFHIYLLDLYYF